MPNKGETKKTSRIGGVLKANGAINRERELLEQTIGITVRLLMDKGTKGTPDVAQIYRKLGGRTKFTAQLLAEVFGSRSMGRKGSNALKPGVVPDFARLSEALVSASRRLAAKGLAGVGEHEPEVIEAPAGRRIKGTVWTFPAIASGGRPEGKKMMARLTIRAACEGGGGGGGW